MFFFSTPHHTMFSVPPVSNRFSVTWNYNSEWVELARKIQVLTWKLALLTILVTGEPLRKDKLLSMWRRRVKSAVSFLPRTRAVTFLSNKLQLRGQPSHILTTASGGDTSYPLLQQPAVERRWGVLQGAVVKITQRRDFSSARPLLYVIRPWENSTASRPAQLRNRINIRCVRNKSADSGSAICRD